MGRRVDATPHLRAVASGAGASEFRRPPHNLEAEQALLGAILVNNEALDRVSGFLSPDHFFDPLHGRIFETLAALIHDGKTATPITVKTFFENVEPIDATMTVPQYLGRLAANATTIINAAEYGRTIYDLATRRSLILIGEDTVNTAYDSSVDYAPCEQIGTLEQRLAELRTPSLRGAKTIAASSLANVPVPARSWHVADIVPHRNVTLLGGDGGTGKSLLALQLAVATAARHSWLGRDVDAGRALYVGAEDDVDEMHRRLADIVESQGLALEELTDLHLHCLAGEDAVLATFDNSNVMATTSAWRDLVRVVRNIRPRLIIADTLADLFGGDEIDRSQTRQFVQLLRGLALEFDLAIVLLAHPSVAGMRAGTGTSGSTAWSNSVRSRLYFERIKEEGDTELDPDARVLTLKKSNYGPPGLSIPLRWVRGVFHSTEGDPAPSAAIAGAHLRAEGAFIELLRTYTEQGRNVTATTSPSYAPTKFAKDDLGRKVGRDALEAAMTRLLKAGTIRNEIYGPNSKRRSRLVIS